jgi:ABC-type transport system involved in cytochrome c biogenesis permease component
MFSKGQIIFGVLFFIVFAIIIGFTYRKDLKLHKRFYAGSIWVLVAFIAFILFIAAIKFLFK